MKTFAIFNRRGNLIFEYTTKGNTLDSTLKMALYQGVSLKGAVFKSCDLSGFDFGGFDLSDVVFKSCNMRGCRLYGKRLAKTRFIDSILDDVDFSHAITSLETFKGCRFIGTNFSGALLGDWGKVGSKNDVMVVTSIGSLCLYVTIFHTDNGLFVDCPLFTGKADDLYEILINKKYDIKEFKDLLALITFAKMKYGFN